MLARWYREHGRHDLPWRATRDRWHVLVAEVMLQQTQVSRVEVAWPGFITAFPTPEAMAAVQPGDVIRAWGRLGYPRRALRLWESARVLAASGWPDALEDLPGVGRYTAAAITAQADDCDVPAVEVNIRRVVERVEGRALTNRDAEAAMREIGAPLRGRDRLLALMDVGATVCPPRDPSCHVCPLHDRCATRGVLPGERRRRQGRFEGSFRQRRGRVLDRLRGGATQIDGLDTDALVSLADDGLAVLDGGLARLP